MSQSLREKVLVVTVEPPRRGIEKLCPDPELRIRGWRIIVNPVGNVEADFWIVFGNARPSDKIKIAPENTLLIVLEPEAKKVYPSSYYRQFACLVDTHGKSGHPNLSIQAPCFSWHVGLTLEEDRYTLGYKELSNLSCPVERKNKISVVCSDAVRTEGQRKRLQFLQRLKLILGDRIDHYGRGFQSIDDKMDAILGYRFHLALENCCTPHYWTEKLIDAYLGWASPIYVGCPNVTNYFPRKSLLEIELSNPQRAAKQIIERMEYSPDESEISELAGVRKLILNKYNPFVNWVDLAEKRYKEGKEKGYYSIHSHKAFRPYFQGAIFRMKSRSRRLTGCDR